MFKTLSAEFIGTFVLVFGGCGSAIFAAGFPGLGIGFACVVLAFGLTVLVMAFAVGHISGGHFNPPLACKSSLKAKDSWSSSTALPS